VELCAVTGAVVGHDSFDLDAVAGEELQRPLKEGDCGDGFLVFEDFDVGEAGGVVDGDVNELPALLVGFAVIALGGPTGGPGDPVAGPGDLAELLDVDVDQLAGPGALIALRGSIPRRPSLPIPIRVRIPETV